MDCDNISHPGGRPVPEGPAHDALRGHLVALYAGMISAHHSAQSYLTVYFRLHKEIRGSARGFLGATSFTLLRRRWRTVLLHAAAARGPVELPPDHQLVAALPAMEEACMAVYRWLREDCALDPAEAMSLTAAAARLAGAADALGATGDFAQRVETDPFLARAPAPVPDCAALAMPPGLMTRWIAQWGRDQAMAYARAGLEPAPLHLRIAGGAAARDGALAALAAAGIAASALTPSPSGVALLRKVSLAKGPLAEGTFEVQDLGSQLVGHAVAPEPGWRVLDACAGAGGKALHLAELVGPDGRVYAHDLDADRMADVLPRARAAGLANVEVMAPGAAAEAGPYDAVLVDAPCLGLGRRRREPSVTWRGDLAERLAEIQQLQAQCLAQYAPLVRPGGVLVYATCSTEPEETSHAVAALAGFDPDPLPPGIFAGLATGSPHMAWLLTHQLNCDGFFVARLRATSGPGAS